MKEAIISEDTPGGPQTVGVERYSGSERLIRGPKWKSCGGGTRIIHFYTIKLVLCNSAPDGDPVDARVLEEEEGVLNTVKVHCY